MSKDWQRGSGYVNEPKVKKELGINSDGYKSGGMLIINRLISPLASLLNFSAITL